MPTPPVAEAISPRQKETPNIAKTKHSRIYVPQGVATSTCPRIKGPQACSKAPTLALIHPGRKHAIPFKAGSRLLPEVVPQVFRKIVEGG